MHCHIHIILQSGGWVCTATFTSFYSLEAGFALPHSHHSTIWTRLESEVSHYHCSKCFICLPYFQTDDMKLNAIHAQLFHIIIALNASPVCHTSRQRTCSEMRSMLSPAKAQPSTAWISYDGQVYMPYPKAPPKCSAEILTSVNG